MHRHGRRNRPYESDSPIYLLTTTLEDKKSYIVHYRNLKQPGLRIKKIYCVLEFEQEAWLKHYVALNPVKRQATIETQHCTLVQCHALKCRKASDARVCCALSGPALLDPEHVYFEDKAVIRWGFLGDIPFPPPLNSGISPYSPQSLSSALKTSLLLFSTVLGPFVIFSMENAALSSPISADSSFFTGASMMNIADLPWRSQLVCHLSRVMEALGSDPRKGMGVGANVEDVERLPKTNSFRHRVDQNRQVPANIVHDEQENADGSRPHGQRNDLHKDCEHYAEPHLS
ncbi:hypothetical protein PR048_019697 [Dryococelus australis]|uniref:Uncharacterized protein n=1 Tax=Dryococelus australis TaxID=614101 RepID=A0ABQ9H471_9NEOP|nr:hypothetical protein PR048_019697 [Dryococelus australis]